MYSLCIHYVIMNTMHIKIDSKTAFLGISDIKYLVILYSLIWLFIFRYKKPSCKYSFWVIILPLNETVKKVLNFNETQHVSSKH